MPLADTKEFENSIWILEADTLLGHREDCNIRGATKVAFLDVDKRHRLNQVDLTLLIEEELNRLTEKVQKTYLETFWEVS